MVLRYVRNSIAIRQLPLEFTMAQTIVALYSLLKVKSKILLSAKRMYTLRLILQDVNFFNICVINCTTKNNIKPIL